MKARVNPKGINKTVPLGFIYRTDRLAQLKPAFSGCNFILEQITYDSIREFLMTKLSKQRITDICRGNRAVKIQKYLKCFIHFLTKPLIKASQSEISALTFHAMIEKRNSTKGKCSLSRKDIYIFTKANAD
jgi:hypothetical protein